MDRNNPAPRIDAIDAWRPLPRLGISGLRGLRARCGGFDFRFGFGRRNLRTGSVCGSARRVVVRNFGGLHVGAAPWPVIDKQHREHAENRDGRCDRHGLDTPALRLILCLIFGLFTGHAFLT